MRRIRRTTGLFFTLAAIALASMAAPHATAEDAAPQGPNADEVGYAEYRQYCAVCHGVFADGAGLVVPILKVAPTDLTTLTERHGSPLPRAKLREYIDGRRPLLAHGSREMPIWGRRLGEGYPNPTPEMTKRNIINAILNYLESLQRQK